MSVITNDAYLIQQQLDKANIEIQDLIIIKAKLESEIQVKSDMLEQIIKTKHSDHDETERFPKKQEKS